MLSNNKTWSFVKMYQTFCKQFFFKEFSINILIWTVYCLALELGAHNITLENGWKHFDILYTLIQEVKT